MSPLSAYLKGGDQVHGWLVNYSARVIADLGVLQADLGLTGSLGEIGVHMGRLFILLKLIANPTERTFAIDVFDELLNLDHSGFGEFQTFVANVKQWTGSIDGIQVIKQSSLSVDPSTVINLSGKARMISVDGGHTAECASNDMMLAQSVLHPYGIAIVDDFFNVSWPDVATGVSHYIWKNDGELRPFAITPNKVYFAFPDYHSVYRNGIRQKHATDFEKTSKMFGSEVDIYGSYYFTNYALKLRMSRNRVAKRFLRFGPVARRLRD
jgi:hypothetical protein